MTRARWINLDWFLLVTILLVAGLGLAVAYSAGNGSMADVRSQLIRIGIALTAMILVAQVSPRFIARSAPLLYGLGLVLLLWVAFSGEVGKGAQRWLDLGVLRFQPSELTKLTVPMMVAWYLSGKFLPASPKHLAVAAGLILVPVTLIARQPDLGTALLVAGAGGAALFLAGLSYRLIMGLSVVGLLAAPVGWHFLHDYQRRRVLTLLDPESDPLGAGYHIMQSKIAVGSGGLFGKGWLQGSQSQLDFIPESSTDFVFAVFAEEFGFVGSMALLALYLVIILRGLWITSQGQDTFSRLFGGSLVFTFFVYLFVNVGMVSGILPVVGVPLPLISYGGTSMATLMIGFGCLMAIRGDRRLWTA